MAWRVTITTATVLVLLAGSFPVGAEEPGSVFVPHPGVVVLNSNQWGSGPVFNPGVGVVGGSGTKIDPYIISGWEFTATHPVYEAWEARLDDGYLAGIIINDRLEEDGVAYPRPHILIENNYFHDLGIGVSMGGVEHITIRNNVFRNVDSAIVFREVRDVVVEDNIFIDIGGIGNACACEPNNEVTIRGNYIDGRGIGDGRGIVIWSGNSIMIENNEITDFKFGIKSFSAFTHIRNNDIHGNHYGIHERCCTDVFADNVIRDNAVGASFYYLIGFGPGGNHITGNSIGVDRRYDGVETDWESLANTWWGSPDGPGGQGPGSGDTLVGDYAPANYEPWLTEPNPNAGATLPEYPEPLLRLLG